MCLLFNRLHPKYIPIDHFRRHFCEAVFGYSFLKNVTVQHDVLTSYDYAIYYFEMLSVVVSITSKNHEQFNETITKQ